MYLQYSVITFSLGKKKSNPFFGISPLFDFLNIFLVFGGDGPPSRPVPRSACKLFHKKMVSVSEPVVHKRGSGVGLGGGGACTLNPKHVVGGLK